MTQQNPRDRPTVDEAIQQFNGIIEHQPLRSLRWSLMPHDGSKFDRFMGDFDSLKHEALLLARSYWRAYRVKNTKNITPLLLAVLHFSIDSDEEARNTDLISLQLDTSCKESPEA